MYYRDGILNLIGKHTNVSITLHLNFPHIYVSIFEGINFNYL